MLAPVVAWLAAAATALDAASSLDAYISRGPLVTYDDVAGIDLVIVGHDDDDDTGTSAEFSGGWHEIGGSTQSGEATAYLCLVSQSGATMTMAERWTAASSLHAAVAAVLFASPNGSGLGASGVMWAQESSVRLHSIPTAAGPIARIVIAVTIRCLA